VNDDLYLEHIPVSKYVPDMSQITVIH